MNKSCSTWSMCRLVRCSPKKRNNRWNTPYLFNAKELDEKTGLYYDGVRYYDPRVSLWLSIDSLQEKYTVGRDGIPANEVHIRLSTNTASNVVKYGGRSTVVVSTAKSINNIVSSDNKVKTAEVVLGLVPKVILLE